MPPNRPPEDNPVLTAYESFQSQTPLVTRYTLNSLAISYFGSYILNPLFALSNIPLYTIQGLELYRILTCNLVCVDLLSLIFAFLSFTDSGKRLEFSMGSTAFLTLCVTISLLSNTLFLIFCECLYYSSGKQNYLLQNSDGIWIVLFGLIAVECANAPEDTKRKLFFFEVPTRYYPCAVLALFSFMAGVRVSWFFSVMIGYAYAHGRLDRVKVSSATLHRWEDGCLRNFSSYAGWVVGHAASGMDAWSDLPTSASSNNVSNGAPSQSVLSSMFANDPSSPSTTNSSSNNTSSGGGGAVSTSEPKEIGFPSSGGRTLGSATSRANATDARAARLAAMERRNDTVGNEA